LSYLLDTNVISELVRQSPNANVVTWVDSLPSEAMHLSALSLGEIRKGVEKLATGAHRERLRIWLEHDLPGWFATRIHPVDVRVADRWGLLSAETALSGKSAPAIDTLIAATALTHNLTLATRNLVDFQFAGLLVINPWDTTSIPPQ
jgi:toxin FitB